MDSPPLFVGVTDYAVNAGPIPVPSGAGPTNVFAAETYSWPAKNSSDGIARVCWSTRPSDYVNKGTTHMLLLGEKHLAVAMYDGDGFGGYDQSFATGECFDVKRYTHYAPLPDRIHAYQSRAIFGSAHSGYINAALLDGSTDSISFGIDPARFRSLGSRKLF